MPVFAWRNEPTRHFGEQPVPFASVGIKDPNERWRTFSLIVDSGAVVSLLCRSVGDLLHIPIESGQRVTVTGVGRRENEVFVHKLVARIGEGPELPTRFAVDFDPSRRETRFSVP
jgi:hypothetical protein